MLKSHILQTVWARPDAWVLLIDAATDESDPVEVTALDWK